MLGTFLLHVERSRQVEDDLAVLDRRDAPGGKRPAVANSLDLVENRDPGIARANEIGMKGMDPTPRPGSVVDGPPGGHEGLARDLPPEHALALLVGAHATEDVDLDGLEIEEGQ